MIPGTKSLRLTVLVAALGMALTGGCEVEPPANEVAMPADTTLFPVPLVPSTIDPLEHQAREVEARLERLLTLIEEKEVALLRQERRLDARADALDRFEDELQAQRVISLGIMGLGVLAIMIGIVVGNRQRGQFKTALEAERDRIRSEERSRGQTAAPRNQPPGPSSPRSERPSGSAPPGTSGPSAREGSRPKAKTKARPKRRGTSAKKSASDDDKTADDKK